MRNYTVTFRGYYGRPDKVVTVQASDDVHAVHVAKANNAGWFAVVSVERA